MLFWSMNRSGPTPDERSEPSQKPRGFSPGWVVSVGAHAAAVAALVWLHLNPSRLGPRPSPVVVTVVEDEMPEPPGPPGPTGDSGTPQDIAQPAPPAAAAPDPKPQPKPAEVPVEAVEPAAPDTSDILTDSQLDGAVSADNEGMGGGTGVGGGGGSGGCNTARVLQNALRSDPMVHNAVINAGRAGKAVMLWNGAWVRAGDQDGRGLTGVRQALLWELAFAPEACRTKQMEGLVTLSLQDGTRFAIGAERWRWSDLLELVKGTSDR